MERTLGGRLEKPMLCVSQMPYQISDYILSRNIIRENLAL